MGVGLLVSVELVSGIHLQLNKYNAKKKDETEGSSPACCDPLSVNSYHGMESVA